MAGLSNIKLSKNNGKKDQIWTLFESVSTMNPFIF